MTRAEPPFGMTNVPPTGGKGKSPTPPPSNERPAEKPTRVNEPSPVRPPDEPVPDKTPSKAQGAE